MNQAQLIQGLNEDLSGELGTIIRYTVQSSKAFGPHGAEVRELLRSEIQDELKHATFLADVIVDLGGEPTTEPQSFDNNDSLRDMLRLDIEMEQSDVTNYTERAALAEKLGKAELKVRLEEMAADEARHARQLRRLVTGM
ncbi:MAG: ferritin-like domain-containing protein [Anaerolineales bacterium]|nr:ferritin-like domain-containing protein [Anaerolineales bacterium]